MYRSAYGRTLRVLKTILVVFFSSILKWRGQLPSLFAAADVVCNDTAECEALLLPGSECIDGHCSNPFQKGGCLKNMLPGWTQLRVCNSDDPPEAVNAGFCRMQNSGLDYMEILIDSQNWESVFFQAWILQILLTEILHVPATIETGTPNVKMDLYDGNNSFGYGNANDFDALKTAMVYEDCRNVIQDPNGEYKACTHVIPEVWTGQTANLKRLEQEGIVESPEGTGMLGQQHWFIPRFTGARDPTLLSYLGLSGEQNRRKLAATFLRPTKWKDYCDLVSKDNCQTDDGVSRRAPIDDSEHNRYFVEGVYTGHFRATDKNDCDKNPTNCTGHIVDYPCGWSSFVKSQTHHLNIALESDGDEPLSNGYTYSSMVEIWSAANATKSNLMALWWTPEVLYQKYLGSDSELLKVNLPPPTQDCIEARIDMSKRCTSSDPFDQFGEPVGACDDTPAVLQKVMAASLFDSTYDPLIPDALRSPGYDAIKQFSISALQIGKMYDYWIERQTDTWNFDPRYAACKWVVENLDHVNSFVPRTYPRVVREEANSDPIFYSAFVLAVIAALLVLIVAALTYRQRKRKVMKYAQVEFLWLLLAGLLLVSLGALILAFHPTDASCVATIWLLGIGYALELVPLAVKIAAINRLMQAARKLKRVVLKRRSLFGAVLLISTVIAIFLALWTALDPPQRTAEYELTNKMTEERETVVSVSYYCSSDSMVWRFVFVGWNCLLLMCASILAFHTRKVQKSVNETHTLAILIYSHFIFVVLRVVLFFLEESLKVSTLESIESLIFSLDTIATVFIYFFPKLVSKDDENREGTVTKFQKSATARTSLSDS